MNKEYIYIDGNVIISDENNNKVQTKYYDNLDDVLVEENLIESMENKIKSLQKKSDIFKKKHKNHYIPIIIPLMAFISIFWTLLVDWFTSGTSLFSITMHTAFGNISEGMVLSIMMAFTFIPAGILAEIVRFYEYRNDIKEEKGINSELEYLKKQIVKEKEELERLKSDKSMEKENKDFRTVKVNDLEQLRMLKQNLELYYDLGYNDKKYYKYYQQGTLDKKLSKTYNNIGIEVAKEYLEEKGPTLVKK